MSKYSTKHRKNRKSFPLLVIVGGLLLVLTAGIASRFMANRPLPPADIEVNGTPSLKVDKEKIDFGKVAFDQPVEATFILTNVGDQTLTFTEEPYVEVLEGC